MSFIFFDLEGPLSPQDNAYELMKLFPQGGRVFEVISRYDDLLALEQREGYEPGDTLALIVPFLILHDVSEGDIAKLAEEAALVDGAGELIAGLKERGWKVFCISTSYEQYARRIVQRVGISLEYLACTRFPLDRYRQKLSQQDLIGVSNLEKEVLGLRPVEDDQRIKQRLDRFFWKELIDTKLGSVVREVKPTGGQRKVAALERFTAASNQSLKRTIVVGDSITDVRMLKAVDNAGGLAIAFNANEYALPYATIGLASTNLGDLRVALEAWERGGRQAVEIVVREKEKLGGEGDRGHFHWLSGRQDYEEPLKVHKRIRKIVREEAGKLG